MDLLQLITERTDLHLECERLKRELRSSRSRSCRLEGEVENANAHLDSLLNEGPVDGYTREELGGLIQMFRSVYAYDLNHSDYNGQTDKFDRILNQWEEWIAVHRRTRMPRPRDEMALGMA
jgi:hypothetical protein